MNKNSDLSLEQIDAAQQAGIITKAQAGTMRAKFTDDANAALIGNEDDMRFVRSFSDVFIAIGIGLLAFGLFGFCKLFGGGALYLAGAAGLWFMAEYFGRKKRSHLPTLLIALAYLVFAYNGFKEVLHSTGRIDTFPAFVTLGAMLLFYWRFRLPFSVALIAISLLILAFSFLGGTIPFGWFLLFSGLILFVVALLYDSKDTGRLTRFADNAFWLHFTAAPLIIHGIAIQILSLNVTKLMGVVPMVQLEKSDAFVLLLIILALALIGLAINRRALLVSSLGYAGFAIAMLLRDPGTGLGSFTDIGKIIAFTMLLLGAGIVFLGVGWHSTRRAMLKVLPTSGVFGKIFPPVPE
jgi:hypothetical protein